MEKTNYFIVEVYGTQASACAQYLGKGSRVLVDAELDWREWTDQQDKRREAVTLCARHVIFEGGRPPADTRAAGGERNGLSAPIAEPGAPVGAATLAAEASAGEADLCRSDQHTSERSRPATDGRAGRDGVRVDPSGSRFLVFLSWSVQHVG